MINHFRTLLLNLSDSGTASEFISPGFVARILPSGFSTVYKVLFPSTDRNTVLLNGQSWLELINGAGIPEVLTLVDQRVNYTPKDFQNFKTPSLPVLDVLAQLQQQNSAVATVLAASAPVDASKYDNLWLQHPNDVYKLAGFIAAYTLRLK
jgi:hypothetical protein